MANQYEFDIDLFAGGNEGGYHMENLPGQKQREYLVQHGYGSDRIVKGRLVDVIHGRLVPDGAPASLIVSTFKFLGSTTSRRFRSARIIWDFAYADPDGKEWPEVKRVSLDDQFVMKMTTFDKSSETKVEAGLQGGGGPAGLSISTGWSRTKSAKIDDHISLYGTTAFINKNAGKPNGAKWVLEENKSQNSGIPSSITTAVLLERLPDRPFIGTIQIKAEMGLASTIENLFGKKSKVDPIVFDPAPPPESEKPESEKPKSEKPKSKKPKSVECDPQNLDSVDLDDIGVVKLHTSIQMQDTNA